MLVILFVPFLFLLFLCNQHSPTQNRRPSVLRAAPTLQKSPACCEEYNAFSLVILTLSILRCNTSLQLSATSHSLGLKCLQQEHISVSALKPSGLLQAVSFLQKNPKFTTMTTQDPDARDLRFLCSALHLFSTPQMKVTVYYTFMLNWCLQMRQWPLEMTAFGWKK